MEAQLELGRAPITVGGEQRVSYEDLIDEYNELKYKLDCIEKTLETWELGTRVAKMPDEVRRVLTKCCKQLRTALEVKLPLHYSDIKEFVVREERREI